MKEYIIENEKALKNAARWFLGQMNDSRIFAFSGEMGTGKTTFIKTLCRELKVEENVSSPSFALIYEYSSPEMGIIYHFDLYRIKEISELYDLGYEDYLYSGNLCFIEWPEIAEDLLPPGTVNVLIEVLPDNSRRMILNKQDKD
ncbi:MAG: tRNA (adenosine(37)-N6)-threonylcarbamoyltransferase complex ATPase subunit type 1 TsaE [Bacteroidota bacterium]